MGCCLFCHPAVNNSDLAGGKACVHGEGAWSLLLCLVRRRGCTLRLLQAAKQQLATVGEAMAAPGLVTPRKQERFQVTLVAHSHLYGPLLTILPHKNLYFAQLAPASREAAQNPASSISAELQRVFANLQIESDKSANKEALFLPICPGSHSSNKFPTTQNQALGLVHRHLWALPVHPGATGPAAAPAPSCLQTCCSTLGNHIIFIFNF